MNYLQLNKMTGTVLLCGFIGIIATLIYNDTLVMDTWEHLRATYLVILGNIPYRDFFEHHHPMLWYTFAPIMQIFPKNAIMIFYIARIFALLCSMGTLYFIYKIIINFFEGKENFIPFLLILLTFFPVWYVVSAFKPEAVAYLFYFVGLYFCFEYVKTSCRKNLVLCGIAFVMAFLFIQTMIFNVIFVGVAINAVCYKRQVFIKDLFYAASVPLLLLLSLGIIVYRCDLWQLYFQLNWLYNTKIRIFDTLAIWNWTLQIFIAFWAAYSLIRQTNSVYIKIISFLLIGEILLIFSFHKAHPHYLFLAFIYASVLIGCYLQKLSYQTLKIPVYAFLIGSLLINYLTIFVKNNRLIMMEYQIINQSEQNAVRNIYPYISTIYGHRFSYYEMFSMDMVAVDTCNFNRFPDYSLESDIKKNQYTYLVYDDTTDYLHPLCLKEKFKVSPNVLTNYSRISKDLWKHK